MHSVRDYLKRRSDAELKGMLLSYCEGYGNFDAEIALLICDILYSRIPGAIDPREEFRRLCQSYIK